MATWNDVEDVMKNNTIDSLDKKTLEELSKVSPPVFNSFGNISIAQHAQLRILRRLEQIEKIEQEKREEHRYKKNLIIAILTLLFAAIASWPIIRGCVQHAPTESASQELKTSQSYSVSSKQIIPKKAASDIGRH